MRKSRNLYSQKIEKTGQKISDFIYRVIQIRGPPWGSRLFEEIEKWLNYGKVAEFDAD